MPARQHGLDTPQHRAAAAIVLGLQRLGYRDQLLQRDYTFPDWFAAKQERTLTAAAFGETPVSYDSACLGVVQTNGLHGQDLVDGLRAFGAPIILEVTENDVREWAVSRIASNHSLLQTFPADQIESVFAQRAQEWMPEALLRAKNIGSFRWTKQLSLFTGLLPELESQIQEELDPILRDTLSATREAYVTSAGLEPEPEQLFKLVFWVLTARVFHDRKIRTFASLSGEPDALLTAVARHYRTEVPRLLNRNARETAADRAWNALDFRNLSVEVLSQIWSTTLVDSETRRRLGIHRTSRTIVRYIIERIPFSPRGDDSRVVFEPCSGSAAFLIGAMHALRQNLFGAPPEERHEYFVRHLAGAECDPFGREISALALTLADFPNSSGWNLARQDVFMRGAMAGVLQRSGVVLCNPPFGRFDSDERRRYGPSFVAKPAELLHLVLEDLHPDGVLGFVLPFVAVDGQGYKAIRERLARRFASLEWTVLPDRAFEADAEIALLIATEPMPHDVTRVSFRRVDDDASAWERFKQEHDVSSEYSANFGLAGARSGFTIPALQEVWDFLVNHPRLGEVAEIHRGLEWHERSTFVSEQPAPGFCLGVPPRTKFNVFEVPPMRYLSLRPEDQRRNSWRHDWTKPKAIFNKSTRSRGRWRLAAFPDSHGVTCFQTYNAAWPMAPEYDEIVLAAALNAPVANAFVSTREGKTDITIETLRLIPMPVLTVSQRSTLASLVSRYQAAVQESPLSRASGEDDPGLLLKRIDALILDGYRMPPRLERQALDHFRGQERPASSGCDDYFPSNFEPFFSLSDYLDPKFTAANAGDLVRAIKSR